MTRDITINLKKGMEARLAAMLVQVSSQYENSSIHIVSGTRQVNAKSIMGMMSLALTNGQMITVTAEGGDEAAALKGIEDYLTS